MLSITPQSLNDCAYKPNTLIILLVFFAEMSPKIPPANQLVWEVFDATVEVVLNNGGKAVKGKARSGAKLGSDDLPLNSVEGYIAHKVHVVKEGETAFGPGFVICAVLDWADICKNERGYLTMNPTFSDKSNR